jgi:transposase
MTEPPLLRPLHPLSSLSTAKLKKFDGMSSEVLKNSLIPGQEHSLKTKRDGTILDGNHRIHVLKERGEKVDLLPREIVE